MNCVKKMAVHTRNFAVSVKTIANHESDCCDHGTIIVTVVNNDFTRLHTLLQYLSLTSKDEFEEALSNSSCYFEYKKTIYDEGKWWERQVVICKETYNDIDDMICNVHESVRSYMHKTYEIEHAECFKESELPVFLAILDKK